MRDCQAQGHVLVEHDGPECLCCGELVTTDDRVGVVIVRGQGEATDPRDRAHPTEWGHAA